MMLKVMLSSLIVIANIRVGVTDYASNTSTLAPRESRCNFIVSSSKIYTPIDLLRCIDEQVTALINRDSGRIVNDVYRPTREENEYPRAESDSWFPLSNFITSLFKEYGSSMRYEEPPYFPSEAAPIHYQSPYQTKPVDGPFDSSGSLNINLFDALYSVSRYDDLKCVPRILCEVASGKTPGESTYRQALGNLEDFGKNAIIGLLSNFDFGEASPVLSFAKAAILGYTSKGNSRICYKQYPKCPRSTDRLVHYLNNHNGGFFRFFNKLNLGGYVRESPHYSRHGDREELKFDGLVLSGRQDNDEGFDSGLRVRGATRRLTFPGQRDSNARSSADDTTLEFQRNALSKNRLFLARVTTMKDSKPLYNGNQPVRSSSRATIRFPSSSSTRFESTSSRSRGLRLTNESS